MPQISVITPVYKVEPYLARCVDSMLSQTFADFEWILVDDGSPDNCPQMCDEYAKTDKRIVVIHQENCGQAVARNRALEIAKGEYIAFVDSDDWVHPMFLEILLKNAQRHHAQISVCGYEKVTDRVTVLSCEQSESCVYTGKEFASKGLLGEIENKIWLLWDKLFHRDCFADVRLPEGRINEDNATVYKIIYEADRVAVCDEVLYYYFQNENSTMNQVFRKKHLDWLLVPEEMIAYFEEKGDAVLTDKCHRMYLHELCEMLRKVRAHLQDPKTERDVRTKLLAQYRHEKRRYPITFRTHPAVMEALFPFRARAYWIWQGIVSKRKRPMQTD